MEVDLDGVNSGASGDEEGMGDERAEHDYADDMPHEATEVHAGAEQLAGESSAQFWPEEGYAEPSSDVSAGDNSDLQQEAEFQPQQDEVQAVAVTLPASEMDEEAPAQQAFPDADMGSKNGLDSMDSGDDGDDGDDAEEDEDDDVDDEGDADDSISQPIINDSEGEDQQSLASEEEEASGNEDNEEESGSGDEEDGDNAEKKDGEDHDGKRKRKVLGKDKRKIRKIKDDSALSAETRSLQEREEERRKWEQEILKKGSDDHLRDIINPQAESTSQIRIHPKLAVRMKDHQIEGVRFMWRRLMDGRSDKKARGGLGSLLALEENDKGTGCILAHNMGLGKTFQVRSMKIVTLSPVGLVLISHHRL